MVGLVTYFFAHTYYIIYLSNLLALTDTDLLQALSDSENDIFGDLLDEDPLYQEHEPNSEDWSRNESACTSAAASDIDDAVLVSSPSTPYISNFIRNPRRPSRGRKQRG